MDQKNLDKEQKDEYFLRLLMGNQQNIYAFILAMVHNRDDADDVLQDTITVMWRNFSSYQPGTSFVAWGLTIARNMVLKFYEKNRHSKLKFASEVEEDITRFTAKMLESGESRIEALQNCLKKLNLNDLGLVRLHYEQGKPLKQIAIERGIPVYMIYRMMGHIHKLLAHCIRKTLFPEGAA